MEAPPRDSGSRIRPLTVYKSMLEQGEVEFEKRVSCPVLLCKAGAVGREPGDDTTASRRLIAEIDTHLVLELRSRDGSESVTFGRSESADLVVAESSVSRVHARFKPRAEVWTVEDLDSRNGSYIGPIKLLANRAEPVGDRAKLQFGNVQAYFLFPKSFMRYLRQGVQTSEIVAP